MIKLLTSFIQTDLGRVLTVLPLVILAKNLLGAGYGIQTNSFKSEYLKRGLYKGFIVYLSIAVIVLVTWLSPNYSIVLNGTEYPLIAGVILTIDAFIVYTLGEFMVLLNKVFKVKKEDE